MAKTVRVGRKRSSLKKLRGLIGKKSKVARKNRSRRRVKLMRGGVDPKKILLIIDPQNDFTPPYEGGPNPAGGSLQVPGAIEDYAKIIELVKNRYYDEIHVSLDTHQLLHIGNPGFWKRVDETGNDLPNEKVVPFSILKLLPDLKIQGTAVLDGNKVSFYKPVDGKLTDYVNAYLTLYSDESKNRHQVQPWIWADHCIEGTEGHKIYKPLQDVLSGENVKSKVKYHIKGQNRLTEMFSIFSAEISVEDVIDKMKLASVDEDVIKYATDYQYPSEQTTTGKTGSTYEEVIQLRNLDTGVNEDFIKELIGDKQNPNKIHVCGEAKTHCVKSSLIDLLERCGIDKSGTKENSIILIEDASSPIGGPDAGTEAVKLLKEKDCGVKIFDEIVSEIDRGM